MAKLYACRAVDALLNDLNKLGYDLVQTNEGTLGCGNWVCVAPDDGYYNFIIKEVCLNEWSSAHTIRRCSKLSKANKELVDKFSNFVEELD